MADVDFHPEARAEYLEALTWYEARSSWTATRFATEVNRLVALIASSPESFPAYDDEHRFSVCRRFPYSLVFNVQLTGIVIVAFAHSSRAAGYWLGRS